MEILLKKKLQEEKIFKSKFQENENLMEILMKGNFVKMHMKVLVDDAC